MLNESIEHVEKTFKPVLSQKPVSCRNKEVSFPTKQGFVPYCLICTGSIPPDFHLYCTDWQRTGFRIKPKCLPIKYLMFRGIILIDIELFHNYCL